MTTARQWRMEVQAVDVALRNHALTCDRCQLTETSVVMVHSECEKGAVILADLTIARANSAIETMREQRRAVTSNQVRA